MNKPPIKVLELDRETKSMSDLNQSSTIVVFSANANVHQSLTSSVSTLINVDCRSVNATSEQAVDHLRATRSPDILVIDISGNHHPEQTLEAIAHVCDAEVKVIVVGDLHNVDLYRRLLVMGVSEYLTLPLDNALLLKTLVRLQSNQREDHSSRSGRWISILGCKGGVGTTTLTAQLARGLALNGDTTLAIDSNYFQGDLDIHLDSDGHYSLHSLVTEHHAIDELVLERAASKINPCLSLIKGRDSEQRISAHQAQELTDTLTYHNQFVVCDIASHAYTTPDIKRYLAGSDIIVLIVTPTLSGIREAKTQLSDFSSDSARIIVVLNQVVSAAHYSLTTEHVEKQLNCEIEVVIPHSPQAMLASSELAKTLVGDKTKVGRKIEHLVALVQPQKSSKRQWMPSWLTRKKRVEA